MVYEKGGTAPKKSKQSRRKFTYQEISVILEEADKMTLSRMAKVGDTIKIVEDPIFVGRFIRLLLYTGIHISNFVGIKERPAHDKRGKPKVDEDGEPIMLTSRPPLSSKDIITDEVAPGEVETYLSYRRVKKEKDNEVMIPLHPEIEQWLKKWLDDNVIRPTTRGRYNQILRELQKRLVANGHDIQLNPKRFRHTSIWLMREAGLYDEEITDMTATTPQTLKKYGDTNLQERIRKFKKIKLKQEQEE